MAKPRSAASQEQALRTAKILVGLIWLGVIALCLLHRDSFTLEAVNDDLKGCGLNAVASETGTPGKVEVRFPDVPGIPDGYEEMREIIEDILPSHVEIAYVFWYITWAMMEERFRTWGDIEALDLTWEALEKLVR